MATRDILRAQSFEEAFAAGKASLEESRFEEATNYFRAALKRGGWSGEAGRLVDAGHDLRPS